MIRTTAFASVIALAAMLAACAPEQAEPTPQATEPAESAPAQIAPDADKYKPAPEGEITVTTPATGARVTSPLMAQGSAINTWFFEGQFVAELLVDGQVIASAPARQAGDTAWTDPGPVQFTVEMPFAVAGETNAELVLSEDMPAYIDEANDIRGPARSVRIPVVLAPAQ